MSKKPITYVHHFTVDRTAIVSRSTIGEPDDKRTYHEVTPASGSRLREVLRGLIMEGGCDVLLPTGYSPFTRQPDLFFTDWMVFLPAWDPN